MCEWFPYCLLLQEEQPVEEKKDNMAGKAVQIVVAPATDGNKLEDEEKEEDDDDEFSFAKFSAMHFQCSATHTYIQQRLKQPLLYHEDEGDTLVSIAVSLSLRHYSLPHYSSELLSSLPLCRPVLLFGGSS